MTEAWKTDPKVKELLEALRPLVRAAGRDAFGDLYALCAAVASSCSSGTTPEGEAMCECGHSAAYHVCTANHDGICPCCEFVQSAPSGASTPPTPEAK